MNHIKILRNTLLFLALSLLFGNALMAQDEETPGKKLKTYLYLDFYKKTDGSKQLVATVKAKIDKKFELLSDLPVVFKMQTDTVDNILGTGTTDAEGKAVFVIEPGTPLYKNSEGASAFLAEFEGNEAYKGKETDVEVKDVELSVKLETIDSVKTVIVNASELINDSLTPVEDLDVKVYVKRMFSLLEIAGESLEEGRLEISFPDDIPGDSIGNLQIITRIEDDRNFGNVENIQVAAWGIPVTERESYKSHFHAASYIGFMLIAGLIALLIVLLGSRKKSKK